MTFTSDTSHPGICAETAAAQALLDRFAAEAGAHHASLSLHTIKSGRVFYSARLHIGREPTRVKSGNGDTIAEAMEDALVKEPFLYFAEAEAA